MDNYFLNFEPVDSRLEGLYILRGALSTSEQKRLRDDLDNLYLSSQNQGKQDATKSPIV